MDKNLKQIAKDIVPIGKSINEIPGAIDKLPKYVEPISKALVSIGKFISALLSDPIMGEIIGKLLWTVEAKLEIWIIKIYASGGQDRQ